MTIGKVTSDGDALIPVTVENTGGENHEIEAVLDTGFSGFLALPAPAIETLDLTYRYELELTLASGERQSVPTYEATIHWNGVARSVEIVEAGEALAGTALFWGYALRLECRADGRVETEALP
jgi:clan AA aspartic protease